MTSEPSQRAVAEEFDRYEARYRETVNDALSFSGLSVDYFTTVKAAYLLSLLSQEFGSSSNLRVIDVGCGIGVYHPLLRPSLGALSGVDVSAGSIERARAANPDVDYLAYDGLRLPYESASFDAAFAICVMHHVPVSQWSGFVAEMARVLRPGGLAIVFEHNPRNPLTQRVVNNCPFDRDAVLLSDSTAVREFTMTAFTRPKVQHILTVPSVGPITRRIDVGLGFLRIGAQYYLTAKRVG